MGMKDELSALGLKPMAWTEVLRAVQERLEPPDRDRFVRLHKNFVGYISQDTLNRFYGFVFSRGLQLEINGFRFNRLESILDVLVPMIKPGLSILDVGAGAGLVATILLKLARPKSYVTQDPCREVRDHLMSMGFAVLPHPAPNPPPNGRFDLILCIDSLGELNADEDGALANPDKVAPEDLPRLIEERYGFAQKLEGWKPYLAAGGKLMIWEPIAHRLAWSAIEKLAEGEGWSTRFWGEAPRHSYLELTLDKS